jgi:hypothetical protein
VCLKAFLAAEWRSQLGGDDSAIGPFVDATMADAPDGPLGDPVKFWRAAWDARFRTPRAASGGSRTGDTMAAARSVLAEIEGRK